MAINNYDYNELVLKFQRTQSEGQQWAVIKTHKRDHFIEKLVG